MKWTADTVKRLFGDNKCIILCNRGHVIEVHSMCGGPLCDEVNDALLDGTKECPECAWSSTGREHIRGYIK